MAVLLIASVFLAAVLSQCGCATPPRQVAARVTDSENFIRCAEACIQKGDEVAGIVETAREVTCICKKDLHPPLGSGGPS